MLGGDGPGPGARRGGVAASPFATARGSRASGAGEVVTEPRGSWGPAEPWAAGLGHQQKNMAPWTLWRCCQRVVGWVPVLFITFVVVWSYYAYVVELCVSTVSRTGEKGKTVVYLVAFHLFFVMFVWSYWMTIFTSPASPSKEVNFLLVNCQMF